ncbi:MAG: DNA internalization-related competence protein ComEC/Rec2 [Candidatus Magasanikbacteria bacterium]|nr:DNA internalization-related competence protein ComEC/Rec2 [Candidatus Magasanikbacteria bacterium]
MGIRPYRIAVVAHSKSKTFFVCGLSFLSGIAVATLVNKAVGWGHWYFLFLSGGGLTAVFWQHRNARLIFLSALFFLFGCYRYSSALELVVVQPRAVAQSFVGLIAAEPDAREDGVRYVVETNQLKSTAKNAARSLSVLVKMPLYPRYAYGDLVRVACDLEAPEAFQDQDTGRPFHYDKYLATQGVSLVCRRPEMAVIKSGGGNSFYRQLLAVKQSLEFQVARLWNEPYAGFMAGILFGYRGGLGNMNLVFQRTGVAHILAISGYNISIIAAVLITICVRLCISRKFSFWLASIGIVLFVLFTGAGGSVVRAGIMGLLVLVGKYLGRPRHLANAFVFTAGLMNFFNPFLLFWDVGFQLSFLATLGIIYISPVFGSWFRRLPEAAGLRESTVTTFSAILATLPLTLYQFGTLSLVAPVANLLILWTIPGLMASGAVAVVLSLWYFPLGDLIAWASWFGMRYVVTVTSWLAGLPWATFQFFLPWWGVVIVYSLIVYYLLVWGKHSPARDTSPPPAPTSKIIVIAAALVIIWGWSTLKHVGYSPAVGVNVNNESARPVRVTFLDIGQGDATLINFADGEQMLVDCGKDARILPALGRNMSPGDREIDYLVVTHPDNDHYGGCIDVLRRFRVRHIFYNGLRKEKDAYWNFFWDSAQHKGVEYTEVREQRQWTIASSTIAIIYPDHDVTRDPHVPGLSRDTGDNNTSVVMKIAVGNTALLLTGDMEVPLEDYLLEKYRDQLPATVLKVGHHGSAGASGQAFVNAVHPRYATISVGKNNDYGHPTRRALRHLQNVGSAILRTDELGDINIELTSGGPIEIKSR